MYQNKQTSRRYQQCPCNSATLIASSPMVLTTCPNSCPTCFFLSMSKLSSRAYAPPPTPEEPQAAVEIWCSNLSTRGLICPLYFGCLLTSKETALLRGPVVRQRKGEIVQNTVAGRWNSWAFFECGALCPCLARTRAERCSARKRCVKVGSQLKDK